MAITVDKLLRKPFMNRSRQEKEDIVLIGRPRPALINLTSVQMNLPSIVASTQINASNFVIVFDTASYDHVEWLTGCDKRQALFCWPCLLFRYRKSSFDRNSLEDFCNESGLRDLTNLGEQIRQHENHVLHLQSVLDLQLFASKIKVEHFPPSPAFPNHKKDIERNREIAKRIIDVICYLISQQKHPRIGSRDKNTLEVEDCLENLHFLRDYDFVQSSLITDILNKIQLNPKIVADMIEAITSSVKKEILKELHQSTFASVILSQHLPERSRSQISAVIRYLKNGEVCERFVGFSNRERTQSSGITSQLIHKIVQDFQIFEKTIAYSLDDSLTMAKDNSLLHEVKEIFKALACYSHIQFVPCHFHDLEDILLRSLSFSVECDLFLKNIMAVGSFFQKGSSVCLKLNDFRNSENITQDDIPDCDNCESASIKCYNAALINIVKTHRLLIKDAFDKALYAGDNLTESDVVTLKGLLVFLTDFKTVFFLETLTKLLDMVAPLVNAFKNPFPGLAFDTKLIEGVLKSFDDELEKGTFDKFWLKIVVEFNDLQTDDSYLSFLHHKKKNSYEKLFYDIVQCLKNQIRRRFEDTSNFAFCQILDLENSAISLNSDHVQTLVSHYGQGFEYSQLSREIKLVVLNKSVMNCESVHGLYKYLITSKLSDSFTNLNKLCEIALSLPSTIPNTSKTTKTKLDEISSWSYTNIAKEHSRDVTFLCVEQDYLMELKRTKYFYDNIIHEFGVISKALKLT